MTDISGSSLYYSTVSSPSSLDSRDPEPFPEYHLPPRRNWGPGSACLPDVPGDSSVHVDKNWPKQGWTARSDSSQFEGPKILLKEGWNPDSFRYGILYCGVGERVEFHFFCVLLKRCSSVINHSKRLWSLQCCIVLNEVSDGRTRQN